MHEYVYIDLDRHWLMIISKLHLVGSGGGNYEQYRKCKSVWRNVWKGIKTDPDMRCMSDENNSFKKIARENTAIQIFSLKIF